MTLLLSDCCPGSGCLSSRPEIIEKEDEEEEMEKMLEKERKNWEIHEKRMNQIKEDILKTQREFAMVRVQDQDQVRDEANVVTGIISDSEDDQSLSSSESEDEEEDEQQKVEMEMEEETEEESNERKQKKEEEEDNEYEDVEDDMEYSQESRDESIDRKKPINLKIKRQSDNRWASRPSSSSFNHVRRIHCKGCGISFSQRASTVKDGRIRAPREYYAHCLNCQQYIDLGLIRKCSGCGKRFMNAGGLSLHLKCCQRATGERHSRRQLEEARRQVSSSPEAEHSGSLETIYGFGDETKAKKPDWMSPTLYKNVLWRKPNETMPCKGCNKSLPCLRNGSRRSPCLEYYVHCLEKCPDFMALGVGFTCTKCGFRFIGGGNGHSRLCSGTM